MATDEQFPTVDGVVKALQLSTGSDHWALVDDDPHDGDGTYVFDTTTGAGARDFFVHVNPSISAAATPAIDVDVYSVTRTDTGTYRVSNKLRINATQYGIQSAALTNTTYAEFQATWTVNPKTGVEWTEDEINRLSDAADLLDEIAIRIDELQGGATFVRFTQVRWVVTYTPASGGAPNTLPAKAAYYYRRRRAG